MGVEKKCAHSGRTYKIYAPEDLTKNWFIAIHAPSGKRLQRKYGTINRANTYDDRMKLAQELLLQLVKTDVTLGKELTVRESAQEWINLQPWKEKSRRSYTSISNTYFDFLGNKKPTAQLTEQFMLMIRQTRYETTYNNYLRKLRRILTGIGYPSLLDDHQKIKERRRPARYFQKEHIRILKAEMQGTELWHFCEFIYYCFIRPKELRHLRAQHIMLDDQQILIPGEISKNGKTEYVAIPAPFLPSLQYVRNLEPGQLLFHQVRDKSKVMGENTMWYRQNQVLQKLNFGKGYTLYSWKHTGAVHFIKNGGSVVELQIQLRHHSLDQVQEYLRQMGVSDLDGIRNNFPAL